MKKKFLVTGKCSGFDIWHILEADSLKAIIYEKKVAAAKYIDLSEYGKVLVTGVGAPPSEAVLKQYQ